MEAQGLTKVIGSNVPEVARPGAAEGTFGARGAEGWLIEGCRNRNPLQNVGRNEASTRAGSNKSFIFNYLTGLDGGEGGIRTQSAPIDSVTC